MNRKTNKKKTGVAVILLAAILAVLPAGCWDSEEIDTLFIVTGIALDLSDNPEEMNITVQVGKVQQESSGSQGTNMEKNSSLLLKTAGDTVMDGLAEINRDSSHKLLMHHNQAILFGTALTEEGIKPHIDLFMRDQQARLEVALAMVEGEAGKALSAKLMQEPISGIFLAGMFKDLAKVSVQYRVRLIDFASKLLEETTAPVMPIVAVTGEEGKQEIKLTGMGVFKGDRLIGRLDNKEAMGYIWAMGHVEKCDVEAKSDEGRAVFHIPRMDCKRKIKLLPDGGVRVELSLHAMVGIGEINGFEKMKPKELISHLSDLAQKEIQKRITDTFEAAKELKADIYGFGTSIYQRHPKQWKDMKDRWEEIFPAIDLAVSVQVKMLGTGQIVQSLEMEENME